MIGRSNLKEGEIGLLERWTQNKVGGRKAINKGEDYMDGTVVASVIDVVSIFLPQKCKGNTRRMAFDVRDGQLDAIEKLDLFKIWSVEKKF